VQYGKHLNPQAKFKVQTARNKFTPPISAKTFAFLEIMGII
jgi:hypothetical protein